jgi:hypothetical protein
VEDRRCATPRRRADLIYKRAEHVAIRLPRAKDIGPSVQVRQRLRRGELKERKLQQAPELRLFRQRSGLRSILC